MLNTAALDARRPGTICTGSGGFGAWDRQPYAAILLQRRDWTASLGAVHKALP
jgi:hypothetical protein